MENVFRQLIGIATQLLGIASLLISRRDRQFVRNSVVRLTLDTLGGIEQTLINFRRQRDPHFIPPEAPVRLEWMGSEYGSGDSDQMAGLHQLLALTGPTAPTGGTKYSILLPLDTEYSTANLISIKQTLSTALGLTAPDYEVLVGAGRPVAPEISALLSELGANPTSGHRLRLVECDDTSGDRDVLPMLNQLAEQATGDHLLLLSQGDLVRPDLLYRYEQTLRLLSRSDEVVLYCNDFAIEGEDTIVPGSHHYQPLELLFPFVFALPRHRGILISAAMWKKAGGLNGDFAEAGLLDLFLRLDLEGARFYNVPIFLLASRIAATEQSKKAADPPDVADQPLYADAGIRSLTAYYRKKGLDWQCGKGYTSDSFRAIPRAREGLTVHVVVPFRNQKELTLRAIGSILRQRNVTPLITAADNRSTDTSISAELSALGIEVLRLDEPFNFSRICNAGARHSRFTAHSEVLLFLNNDVELDEGALEEMGRWIYQERVGIVGARLHFPDDTIQHAGVELVTTGSHLDGMLWRHIDYKQSFPRSDRARQTGVCDAITGACLMIRRATFEAVEGFDEVWYPVALSDTDLAVRVRRLGLCCLYTPFAFGTHFENATRRVGRWEDFDFSHWLYQNARMRGATGRELLHPVFGHQQRDPATDRSRLPN